jgi:hypothetical protein
MATAVFSNYHCFLCFTPQSTSYIIGFRTLGTAMYKCIVLLKHHNFRT